ncbi:MAG TPA: tRNA-(ms[2]io[6]A)-hydroxylase [Steroidobacteraceae bacterium]|nr:tRNA-(ms[2]io[6]A)-hydroxylase [Steroidobacteraceae bacterium]
MSRSSVDAAPDSAATLLRAPTPPSWVEDALAHLPELLQDHANCEKKAASSALALMFAYPEDRALGTALSRLAREELRHFEQVNRAMSALGIPYVRQRPGRYAQGLRRAVRSGDPGRKLDLLLTSALIEARSAERFGLLAPHMPGPLARLYRDLAGAEARHFTLYVGFAQQAAADDWQTRLGCLALEEAQLATRPDTTLRFHSGPLQAGT